MSSKCMDSLLGNLIDRTLATFQQQERNEMISKKLVGRKLNYINSIN